MKQQSKVPAFDPEMSEYEAKFITVGEAQLKTHYIESGSGEPLLLIHGGGPGADAYGNWHASLPGFAENFHCVCVDMLGFGQTDKPEPENFTYSQAARTQHMIDFIEALDIGPVSLIGNSMGGLTSLGVAIDRPDLVNKLVLMGPAAVKDHDVGKNIQPLLNYGGTVEAMRAVVDVLTHDNYVVDDALLNYRVRISTQAATMRAQKAAMAWIKEQRGLYFEDERIQSLTVPALIVGGKNDPVIPPRHIFRLSELIEDSRAYLMPDCGHWVMLEYPQEFVAICNTFLQ